MDCGEGIAGQIHRFYGSKADEIFRRIKCITITHLHSDHHLGKVKNGRSRSLNLIQNNLITFE